MATTGRDDADMTSGTSWRAAPRTSDLPPSDPPDASSEDFLFHLYRGSELLKDNQVYEAKEELENALTHKPQDEKGQDLLAAVYFRLGLYPRAVALYDQLLRRTPKQPALLLNLALCHLKTGQPSASRPLLEQLVGIHPSHTRAWGYLGLSYERLGEFARAEHAYRVAGHSARALRMAEHVERRIRDDAVDAAEARGNGGLRDIATAAFDSIDKADSPFSLATPASAESLERGASWHPIEMGQSTEGHPSVRPGPALPVVGLYAHEQSQSSPRRPTLVVAPPPAHVPADVAAELAAFPSAPAAPNLASSTGEFDSSRAPVPGAPSSLADAVRTSQVDFPPPGGVKIHASGLALVRTRDREVEGAIQGFAVRMDALRATHAALGARLLSRRMRGKETSEPFGGITSPVVELVGKGELVCGARAGFSLAHFVLHDETCFLREDAVVGFDLALSFENGRLMATEGDVFPVVQLKGSGGVLIESKVAVLSLEVTTERSLHVRRETVIGWMGRIVPRALPPGEAPCGQRGLIAFAGDGAVLLGA